VFTGVSGSGKSSLVFSTIAAESQRMINETYSAFVQGFMPTLARPEVDVLDGLTTAIILDQERMGANPRSTVGTATDANAMLRILFSRLGKPHIGSPNAYSFNVPSVRASGAVTVERGAKTKTEKATFTRLGWVSRSSKFKGKDTADVCSRLIVELGLGEFSDRLVGVHEPGGAEDAAVPTLGAVARDGECTLAE
jgi:excinuclease UvrABC ATPase subunit